MTLQQAILNSVYGSISKTINILYEPTNNLFDSLLINIPANFYYLNKIENYYYDMVLYHNTMNQQLQKRITEEQLKSLLFIHNSPPPSFKKEDLFIFKEQISNINKIVFSEHIAKLWGFEEGDCHIMNYGIPEIQIPDDKTIPVLVLNLDNNPQIDNLYRHIQSHIPNSLIIKAVDNTNDWNSVIQHILRSKIVIDISQRSNILFCLGCGCKTISPFNDIKSEYNYYLDDFNKIMYKISEVQQVIINDYTSISKDIITKYSYEQFIEQLTKIINQIKYYEVVNV
jgi:hypothetical protein